MGVCTKATRLQGSHLKPLYGEDPSTSFFSIFINLAVLCLNCSTSGSYSSIENSPSQPAFFFCLFVFVVDQ